MSILVEEDAKISKLNFEKFKNLRPVFKKDGTITGE